MTASTTRRLTRLSLRKLYLSTTEWIDVTVAERLAVLTWLDARRSRTARRNQFDDGYENFLTFPVARGSGYLVPLGHLTAFNRHYESASDLARIYVPQVIGRREFRQPTYGDEVLRLKVEEVAGASS